MGFSPVRAAMLAISFAYISQSPTAFAEALLKFCDIDTEKGCVTGFLKNRSAATVISIDVSQRARHGCEKDERHINRNLWGGFNGGREARIHIRESCRYDVKFNVTSGCKGHKSGSFSRKNLEGRRHQMNLIGGCWTLTTDVVRPRPTHSYKTGQPGSYPSDETESEAETEIETEIDS